MKRGPVRYLSSLLCVLLLDIEKDRGCVQWRENTTRKENRVNEERLIIELNHSSIFRRRNGGD